ncbi:MAG: PEGA domain-containing protein [Sideroxydans sp.]|nr:PEGA domain-containing protein [Sideroxydans sp.]
MLNVRLLVATCLLPLVFTGCAGMFGSAADPGNEIRIREDSRPAPEARQEKYPITIRLGGYTDARGADSPRRLGISTTRIIGMYGADIMSDKDVAEVVAASIRKRLDQDGMQVLSGTDAASASFQLSGSVKELSFDAKDRDYVSIALESTLTDLSSGKVIWSGVVVEKADRYSGVAGNSKKDIADFLRKELGVVAGKTSESMLSVLMATRPDLFNLAVGGKPVQGVTVYGNAAPAAVPAVIPAPSIDAVQNGTLAVSSTPPRAKVYVDGVYFGLTPMRAEIAAGVREVSIKLDGYQAATEKVSVRKGDTTELETKLQR